MLSFCYRVCCSYLVVGRVIASAICGGIPTAAFFLMRVVVPAAVFLFLKCLALFSFLCEPLENIHISSYIDKTVYSHIVMVFRRFTVSILYHNRALLSIFVFAIVFYISRLTRQILTSGGICCIIKAN